jgi:hypothetical protein
VARRQWAVDPQLISFGAGASRLFFIPGKALRKMRRPVQAIRRYLLSGDIIMGKYLVGWLLGVPVFVLVILYFFFH